MAFNHSPENAGEDLGEDQTAEVLRRRPGTVRGYASRALANLRVHIEMTMGVL